MDDALLKQLRQFDTPTICNALELVAPERRGHGFTKRPFVCVHPDLEPMVGFARTARIAAAAPSGREPREDAELRQRYYRHMAEGPRPALAVIEDMDDPPGVGAWWGEVHTHVHRGLGLLGVITNGSVRDLDQAASGFQQLAGSVGPSHAYVHVEDLDCPVAVHGMSVRPGDLVHADRHGAVVIPAAVAESVPGAVDRVVAGERPLIEASKHPDFDLARLESLLRGEGH